MCPIYLCKCVWSHTKSFSSAPAVPAQWGWQVSRTEHLALEKETTEGDGHGSGTMATVQTHYTAERGGGVKLTTDSRILRIRRL